MTARRRRGATLEETFDQTLALARLGDGASWERIYRAYAGRVSGYLRVQGAHEPEDITSDVFLSIVRNVDSFTGDENHFRSWMFVIAHRRLIDERRRRTRRDELLVDDVSALRTPDGDAEEDAHRRLGSSNVRELCGRLAPDQRDVLLLRLVADLTIDQIAEVLGKTPGAVKALQRRGLAALGRLSAREGVLQ